MIRKFLFALCVFGLSFLHSDDFSQNKPCPVIVDTDMGIDDVMAFLSLLQKPTIEVKAITVCGTGIVHSQEGIRNIQRLLSFLNKQEIPVACGREYPLKGGHPFPDAWRDHSDNLLYFLPFIGHEKIDNNPSCNAVELLLKTLEDSSQKITILALGPLTNIAELFSLYPGVKNKIEKLYIMGGAVDVPGNLNLIKDNVVAEWNIFADPFAAQEVLQSGVPIYLIALDVTNQVPMTMEFYEYVKNNQKSKSVVLFHRLLLDFLPNLKLLYFWDPLTAEILVDPLLAHFEPRLIDVVTTEGPHYGQTVSCDTGYQIQLATQVDSVKFLQVFFDTMNAEE